MVLEPVSPREAIRLQRRRVPDAQLHTNFGDHDPRIGRRQLVARGGSENPIQEAPFAGSFGVLAGLLLHFTGICPVVKRIWTPAWTLYSGGVCFFFLAAFSWVIEVKGYKKWAFPLVVVGMNSIAAYLIAHLFEEFIADSLRINLGANFFAFLGTGLQPLLNGAAMLLVYWLILFWMYRRKLFLKI